MKLLTLVLAVVTVVVTTAIIKLVVEVNANLRYAMAAGAFNEGAAKYLR